MSTKCSRGIVSSYNNYLHSQYCKNFVNKFSFLFTLTDTQVHTTTYLFDTTEHDSPGKTNGVKCISQCSLTKI